MSDNTCVFVREQKDGTFVLRRLDVSICYDGIDGDPDYDGYEVGTDATIQEATALADQECAEYGYRVVWYHN